MSSPVFFFFFLLCVAFNERIDWGLDFLGVSHTTESGWGAIWVKGLFQGQMCIFEADKGYDNCRSMSHSAGVGHPPKKTQHLGASASSDTVSTPLSLHFLASCFSGPVSATLVMCSLSSVVSPHPGLGLSPFVTPGLPTPSPVLMPQISRRVHLAHEDQSAYLPWGGEPCTCL
jgi:hypothetical protein